MSFERPTEIEQAENYSSKIELKFLRHDEKKKAEDGQDDNDLRITEKGRLHAKEEAKLDDISQSVAFGSPRKRSQETALYHMAGKLPEITGQETLEELRAKIDSGLGHGSKISVDKRLDFNNDESTPFGKKATEAFYSKRYLKFLVEESNDLARENKDELGSTYDTQARGVASIILKYVSISPKFDKLAKDSSKNYRKEMQRFFGTHQGVAECFLAKVIEKTKGVEERDRFVSSLNNQGFGYSEGFSIDLINNGDGEKPVVKISYSKRGETPESSFEFDQDVPIELIEEIAG